MRPFAGWYPWLWAAVLWTPVYGDSALSIYRDQVYIDAGTQAISQNISSSILGLNLPTMDAFITAKGTAEYEVCLAQTCTK
ncbi:hypothetical protein H4R34_003758 [Dimargaris verticillata]|uniref:Uncharacterized protein n=1 Tax=Dimargaris verticillata TaxID=2761393 RepID=A0A9W8B1I9_9FUNG|nr:hypothetical protein H4R34_003758 [Dimargaris verticillata]